MSRPWGQAGGRRKTDAGTSCEAAGAAEVFDCGCRYAISEGWAPCALHAWTENLRDLVRDLARSTPAQLDAFALQSRARALLDRIDRGWRHA